mmetsp:Transcript_5361/g.7956  ORF Transcript_5361/g.7956 Transcript_5361/m.7956 type:complete len:100 (-) Transcript_5361:47-346(-)
MRTCPQRHEARLHVASRVLAAGLQVLSSKSAQVRGNAQSATIGKQTSHSRAVAKASPRGREELALGSNQYNRMKFAGHTPPRARCIPCEISSCQGCFFC